MTRVLALVDGSIYSKSVCDHAAWVASRRGAEVALLHVIGRRRESGRRDLSGAIALGARTALLDELSELDARAARLAQERGRAILADAEDAVRAGGVQRVSTRLRIGDLVEEVSAAAGDLVMVGKRGEAADFATGHLGSNLERVVRAAERPVFVASRAFRPIRRVLIAYDGGASVMKAVDHLARSPLLEGLAIRLLTVGRDAPEARRGLEGAQAILRGGGLTAEVDIRGGQPETAIAEAVEREGADLLVMGAYGRSRIRKLIIGSTTEAMMRGCPVPVMLFR